MEILINKPDYECLMIDASYIKVCPYVAGTEGGNQDTFQTKWSSRQNTSDCRCAWYSNQNPCYKGTRVDCQEAVHLIDGISTETLLANWSYGTNDILSHVVSAGIDFCDYSKEKL